jgi:hypothetical protein
MVAEWFDCSSNGLLTFCGSDLDLDFNFVFDINGLEGKNVFRQYENGQFSHSNTKVDIPTRHTNIVRGVLMGKKSWGLHVNMWIEGICEGTLRIQEITEDFESRGLKIPDSLISDLRNRSNTKTLNKRGGI